MARKPFSVELTPTQVDGDGPPLWIERPAAAPPPVTVLDLDYGVRDTGALTPRDRNGHVLPQWRGAIILVDTSSARWTPAELSPATTLWNQALSVANGYYTEVSGGALTIGTVNSTVDGPVALPGEWDDNSAGGSSGAPGYSPCGPVPFAITQTEAMTRMVDRSGIRSPRVELLPVVPPDDAPKIGHRRTQNHPDGPGVEEKGDSQSDWPDPTC